MDYPRNQKNGLLYDHARDLPADDANNKLPSSPNYFCFPPRPPPFYAFGMVKTKALKIVGQAAQLH